MKALTNAAGFLKVVIEINKCKKAGKKIDQAKASGEVEKEIALIHDAVNNWSNNLIKHFDVKINVINPENLPKNGPVVYIANHQSYFDILVLCAIMPHQIGFIAKEELSKAPVVGDWIKRIRGLFINRGDARESLKSINEGAALIKQGFSMVIFPEGTRSHKHEMADFKPGAFKLATKPRVPVIPITIDGTYKAYEEQGQFIKGQTVNITVHEAINTADLDRLALSELPAKVENIIREDLNRQ